MVGIIVALFLLLTISGIAAYIFIRSRGVIRYAKGVERGIKMVPMIIHLPPSSDDIEVGTRDIRDVLQEKVSQAEVLYNVLSSTAQKGFKSNFHGQRHVSIELVSTKGIVYFYIVAPIALAEVAKESVLSAYPTAQIEEVQDHNIFSQVGKVSGTIGGEFELKKDFSYPIATIADTKRDGMQSLINTMSTLGIEDGASVQILLRPANEGWEETVKKTAAGIRGDKGKKKGFSGVGVAVGDLIALPWKVLEPGDVKPEDKQLSSTESQLVDSIEQKTRYPGYEVLIRVMASSNTANRAQSILRSLVSSFALFDSQASNGFKFAEAQDIEGFITAFIFRFFPPEKSSMILNSVEMASVFHLPDDQFTSGSQVNRQATKQVDSPSGIPSTGIIFGYNVYRGIKKEIRISNIDRARHIYMVGQTGTGKSTVLENLAYQDMVSGNGFAFIDPHGDTAEKLMAMVPKERAEDVIYFNPSDLDNPVGLNLYEHDSKDQRDFLVQEAVGMLYKLYDPQHQGIIGPRYEHWFRNASLTIMADPKGATFIEIPKVFEDNNYVKEKLKYVTDPTVQSFWNDEMAKTSDYHKSEVLGWFISKFGAFRSNEMMRNIIGQVKSGFSLRDVMDNKKILLVNLSKGRTGELNSKLLGMIFVMQFQAAAMSRANIDEADRVEFSLYVDEFQNFSTDSFATILSEARKYKLNLIVANQFISQLTEEIRDAVFGNVGTKIAMRTSATDADFLVKEFAPVFDTSDIVKLPNYNAIIKMMVNGVPSQPFSMSSLPPFGSVNKEVATALKQLSAAKYGKPRALVEADIFERMKTIKPAKPASKLAGAKKGLGPGSVPAAGAKKSNSSFLDEWLAKKKAQSGSATTPTSPTAASLPQSIATNPQPISSQNGQGFLQQPQPSLDSTNQQVQPSRQAIAQPMQQQNAQVPNSIQRQEANIPLSQTNGSQQGDTLRIER
ncbi:type IV secretory system conjugative DNA transfer family protein [Candidatus Saccharibacteria bacterium]|nr:type IV secretory system conjugative DNA transfer family protein [Candidatus Saccharibacteria bacterium]